MAKFIFDPTGCTAVTNKRYVVDFYYNDEIVASFQVSSPLTYEEAQSFIDNRKDALRESKNIHVKLRAMKVGERHESGLGLSSLAYYLEGFGITKKTINVVIDGVVYKVDPDKITNLIKSLQ